MTNNDKLRRVADIKSVEELASLRHSQNVNEIDEKNLSFGDRIADSVADHAGSWGFIITFMIIIIVWIIINSMILLSKSFDPFPFILLNLILSCIAALQAPIIMMSQNRQETKDRLRAEHDYEINLKAEIIIEEVLKRLNKLEENQHEIMDYLKK